METIKTPSPILGLSTLPKKLFGISLPEEDLFDGFDIKAQINELGNDVEFLLVKGRTKSEFIFNQVSEILIENGLDYDSPSVISLFEIDGNYLLIKIDSGFQELSDFSSDGEYEIVIHFSNSDQIENPSIKKIVENL